MEITQDDIEAFKAFCSGKWNYYYMAYALETGAADPDQARLRDKSNLPFILWNGERKRETGDRIGAKMLEGSYIGIPSDEIIRTMLMRLSAKGINWSASNAAQHIQA